MSKLMIEDLTESKSLDREAMSSLRGGLSIGAMVFSADQSQTIGGPGSSNVGNITAVNAPIYNPVNNIVENSPTTVTDIDMANLTNVSGSGVNFS